MGRRQDHFLFRAWICWYRSTASIDTPPARPTTPLATTAWFDGNRAIPVETGFRGDHPPMSRVRLFPSRSPKGDAWAGQSPKTVLDYV